LIKIFSFGIGPISISWLLKIILTFFPSKNDLFYIGIILACFLPALTYLAYKKQDLPFKFTFNYLEIKEKINFEHGLALIFMLIIWAACFFLPVEENDALEYALMAKIIYRDKTLALYPFLNADFKTGFQSSSSHPLGYIGLIVWDYIIQGNSKGVLLMRFVNPYYATLLLFLLKEISLKKSSHLFLLTIPFLWVICIQYQIDIMRIFFFTLSLFILPKDINNINFKQTIMIILSVCGALFSHAIGLMIIFFLPLVIIFNHRLNFKLLFTISKIIFPAILIGGDRYIYNFFNSGLPISDNNVIWSLPQINEALDLVYRRNIYDFPRKLFLGLFQGFTKIHLFGPVFILALISSFTMLRTKMVPQNYKISALVFYTFHGIALLSMIFGSTLMIKNPRYFLSMTPLAAYMSSYIQLPKYNYLFKHLLRLSVILFSLASMLRPINSLMRVKFQPLPTNEFNRLTQLDAPEIPILKFIRALETSKKFLVFEQNKFAYYTDKNYVRDLDSSLMDFYKLTSIDDSFNFLINRNIRYIYLTPYIPATFYNSIAMQLASDPRYFRLLRDLNGYRLFKLEKRFFKKIEEFFPTHSSLKKNLSIPYFFSSSEIKPDSQFSPPISIETNYFEEKIINFKFNLLNKSKEAQFEIFVVGEGMLSFSIKNLNGKASQNVLRAVLEGKPKMLTFQVASENIVEITCTVSPRSRILIKKCALITFS